MSERKMLKRTQFGNPVLRQVAKRVGLNEIASEPIQDLIADMWHTLISKKLGIGLAAPQVGKSLAVAVIAIRPTELRPKIEPFDAVFINPEIVETRGRRKALWEGCISSGSGGKADLFGKALRYSEVVVKYYDETGQQRTKTLTGLPAQVAQHEIDHLNGVLFVDRVRDTETYMTYSEYLAMAKKQKQKSR